MEMKFEPKCNECKVTGNFCGYHNLRWNHLSLCMACAEKEIIVYKISLDKGDSNVYVERDIEYFFYMIDEREEDNGYFIEKSVMTMIEWYSLEEFQGF